MNRDYDDPEQYDDSDYDDDPEQYNDSEQLEDLDFLDDLGQPDDSEQMDSLSDEELHQKILEDKRQANRSLILAFSALVAVVVVCIAWFVANNIVKGGTDSVAAEEDVAFELASVGMRQDAEKEHYLKDDSDDPVLVAGTEVKYDSYYDLETGEMVASGDTTYYLGTSGIAWYQDGQTEMEPGAKGRLEFYIIPKKEGLKSVTITLKAEAYTAPLIKNEDGTEVLSKKAKRVQNTTLQSLIDGHILMFRHLGDDGYSGWIPPVEAGGDDEDIAGVNGNVFTISARDAGIADGTFQQDMVYKVTVYWVWPRYFRNYIYDSVSQYGDLFADISDVNKDYKALIEFVNNQKTMGADAGSKLFYNKGTTDRVVTDQTINSGMSEDTLNACDRFYNQADEYIGTKAGYIYLNATVN